MSRVSRVTYNIFEKQISSTAAVIKHRLQKNYSSHESLQARQRGLRHRNSGFVDIYKIHQSSLLKSFSDFTAVISPI